MRRIFVVIAVVWAAAALMPSAKVFAQDSDRWVDGCDERTFALIADYITDVDYTGACEQFYNCTSQIYDGTSCGTFAANRLLTTCSTAECYRYGLLLSAMIAFFGDSHESEGDSPPSQIVIDLVPQILQAYQEGTYSDAMAHLKTIERESGLDDQLMAQVVMSQGLIHETLGASGNALAEYDRAIGLSHYNPLIGYTRVMLLDALGQGEEVAFEAERVIRYMRSAGYLFYLETLFEHLEALQEKHPFRFDLAEEWLAYPFVGYAGGGGMSITSVRIYNDPVTIGLIKYAPTGGIVILGLQDYTLYVDLEAAVAADFMMYNEQLQSYANPSLEVYYSGVSVYLQPLDADERVFSLRIYHQDTDGNNQETLLVTRANAPDPRAGIPGLRCGDYISLLRRGAAAYPMDWEGGSTPIFDAPNGIEIGQTSSVTILQDHQCVDNTTMWWQARSEEGVVGWIQENNDIGQLIRTATSTLVYCPGIPMPRLVTGLNARVIEGTGSNNVRSEPSREADVMGQIPEGEIFEVVRGAVCADGYLWWFVNYNGVEGWTAEGLGDDYWLEPIYEE